jgi:hypothetical protein
VLGAELRAHAAHVDVDRARASVVVVSHTRDSNASRENARFGWVARNLSSSSSMYVSSTREACPRPRALLPTACASRVDRRSDRAQPTVTVTGADVVAFPAASFATAVSVCAPLPAGLEFHDALYGAVVSVAISLPSA